MSTLLSSYIRRAGRRRKRRWLFEKLILKPLFLQAVALSSSFGYVFGEIWKDGEPNGVCSPKTESLIALWHRVSSEQWPGWRGRPKMVLLKCCVSCLIPEGLKPFLSFWLPTPSKLGNPWWSHSYFFRVPYSMWDSSAVPLSSPESSSQFSVSYHFPVPDRQFRVLFRPQN